LPEVVRFYTEGVGLPRLGGFEDRAEYSGVFIGLPGAEYHLEFTEHVDGSPGPAPTRDTLLVLYVRQAAGQRAILRRLAALGYEPVEPENPYWLTIGAVTVEDPDGWRLVLAPGGGSTAADGASPVRIERHAGSRDGLRSLFALAEDCSVQLNSYLDSGQVLVAASGDRIVGHLQLTDTELAGEIEIKDMADAAASAAR